VKTAAEPEDLRTWLDRFVRDAGFLARYPYYAHVLAAIEPVIDPSVPAMGVSLHRGTPGSGGARYYLHVHVEQLFREPQFLRGILLHEVHHVVLGHLAHPKFFDAAHPDLMQIAMETSANEHIDEPLPSPVLWQHFERFGMRAGQSTIDRYELLCAARAEKLEPLVKRDTRMIDEHRWREQAEPPAGGVEQTRRLIDEARERGEEDAKRANVRTIAGRTPGQLIAELTGTEADPEVEVDWRTALQMFVARARAPVHTWSRPSRRFPGRTGEIPGRSYQPRAIARPTLIVAIDTSLSMTERELAEIARQLRPMSEVARLVIVECDAGISRVYPFRGALTRIEGRGGTDLRPALEPRFLRSQGADGVVYFTDGQGPHPEVQPAIPVLWMLTKPADFACPWGARARLARTAPASTSSRSTSRSRGSRA
jgi:predicted metal-dependent peptidase